MKSLWLVLRGSQCLRVSAAMVLFCGFGGLVFGQDTGVAPVRQRIVQRVNESERMTLSGNVHPATMLATEESPADPNLVLDHLILQVLPSAERQAELDQLLAGQSDPESEHYRQFLTPAEFGARFGADPADLEILSLWLQSHGLRVTGVAAGQGSILFSGTVAQVSRTFHVQMRQYTVNGVRYLANANDPQVPVALAGAVGGVVGLNNFQLQAYARPTADRIVSEGISPAFSPSGRRWLTPGDYATIYDINPLLSAGIDGTGQSIAVIARSNIYLSDVRSFRSMFGLKANDPQVIITNSDPGIRNGDNIETTLDTEWAGAVAPGATIKVIVSSSGSGDGIVTSSLYAVNQNVAPIITVSYGACEAQMGASGVAFFDSLWKQAAAQGQTVLVASGDSGAAGCDGVSTPTATGGRGVNGLCSSPYSTCVGGTQFVEGPNPGLYWLPTSPGSTLASALGYIPESVWNESGTVAGGSGLASGGGGASIFFPKPSWQTGPGVPADGKRDVPDVSLTAAAHDGYTVVQGGTLGYIFGVSGTSASTPSLAGIMALVNQRTKSIQGNINPILYALAAKQATGGAAIFHDVKTGDNSVPGQTGFSATTGYDLATGLGSVDANLLATLWTSASTKTGTLSIVGNAANLNVGQTGSTTVSTVATGLSTAVTLAVSGLPAGVTATFAPASIAAPGSGSSVLTLAATAAAVPGTYTVQLTATAGSLTATSNFSLTLTTPTFALSYGGGLYPSVNFGPNPPYTSQTIKLQTLPANGFNSPITLTASGMPAGMTVKFAPATLAGSTVGNSVATVAVASTVKGGNYSFTITATGGGVTQSVKYLANVFVQPSCTLTPNLFSTNFKAGSSAVLTLACNAAAAGTTPVSLSIAGAPSGVTATFSAPTVSAGKSVTLTIASTAAVTPGTYALNVTGSETSGATQTLSLYAAIGTPVFALTLNPAAVTGIVGSTTSVVAQVTPEPGFNSPVTVWIGSRPNGVSASFSPAPNGGLGNTITLTLDGTTVPGTYPLTIGAIANTGFSRTVVSTLTVLAPPTLTMTSSAATLTARLGATGQVTLTSTPGGAFNSAVAFNVTGLPSDVTATFSKPSLAAPGNGTTAMAVKVAATAKTGTYRLSVVATGGGLTATVPVTLSITK